MPSSLQNNSTLNCPFRSNGKGKRAARQGRKSWSLTRQSGSCKLHPFDTYLPSNGVWQLCPAFLLVRSGQSATGWGELVPPRTYPSVGRSLPCPAHDCFEGGVCAPDLAK